jgi:NAD(P)H-hydrate epimerase
MASIFFIGLIRLHLTLWRSGHTIRIGHNAVAAFIQIFKRMTPGLAEIFSISGVRHADAWASAHGRSDRALMQAAGEAVAAAIKARWSPRPTTVFVGAGKNGGDGIVVACRLQEAAWPVTVARVFPDRDLTGESLAAAQQWQGAVIDSRDAETLDTELFVDAIFGIGLSRPPEGRAAQAIRCMNASGRLVVAVDIPSGMVGDSGHVPGEAVEADLTVTFHRLRPAHLLFPARAACGEIVCADIGIEGFSPGPDDVAAQVNSPDCWPDLPVSASSDTHKHRRGRLAVLSGPAKATGAARLAAEAGLRAGAGLVTILTPPGAALVNASQLTEVMIRSFKGTDDFLSVLENIRATAAVLGPGAGKDDTLRKTVIAALSRPLPVVLDGDALSVFEDEPEHLLGQLRDGDVLTPHAGEFERLFPGLAETAVNKIGAARTAAQRAGCVVVFKGPDTVVAAPDGRVRVNVHASTAMATAGTGDTLAGIVGAFLAQGAPAFDAASAAVWLHGDAGLRSGQGLIAGDILDALPGVLQSLTRHRRKDAARRALIGR